MKFINRLGYYLGGFAIGLVVLAFFLNGKNASCSYGPNARTVKNISSKPLKYSSEAQLVINQNQLDSTTVVNLIKYGDVSFKRSIIREDSCNTYVIENQYKDKVVELSVLNCESEALISELIIAD